MSRNSVIQLLVLAFVVGAGALGISLWQSNNDPQTTTAETATDQAPSDSAQGTTSGTQTSADASSAQPTDTRASQTDTTDATDPTEDVAPTEDSSQAIETADAISNDAQVPTFDLMRVEPDGSAVVAGRAEAGSIIALLSNGEVVGKGVANASGEFAIVLEQPLEPGGHAVTLETQLEGGEVTARSAQSLTVSVPETPDSGEVLVMLNEPGAPSQILQKPETIAAAPSADTVSSEGSQTADASTATTPETPTTEAPTSSTTEVAATTEQTPGDSATDENTTSDEVASAVASADTASEGTAAAAQAVDTTQTADASESETASGTDIAAPAQPAQTAQAQPTENPAPDAAQQVTVEAVETEDDKVFVAGAGEPNSQVRVYLDNELVGEAQTNADGRWLMEADSSVEPGQVEVRADQVTGNEGDVVARAEVTFQREDDAVILRPVAVSGQAGDASGAEAAASARQVPNVIIRRGDNLWTISQRRYGEGLRYTTIYQANQDQIRNPDLIYPGQVFMLPEGDRNWPAAN